MSAQPDLPRETDVVIVGGGVMGTSIAYFLATRSALEVTLLEKDTIAAGSTGDSSAILRHHYGDQDIYTRMAWWSHEFYRAFEAETGNPLAHADNPMVRFGHAGTPEGDYVEAGYDVLSSRSIPVSRYDADELPARYPMVAAVDDFDFAVSDDAAAYSDGTDAAGGFARAARDHGARIVTDVAVTDVHVSDGTVTGVETDGGTVACSTVVLAAGPWTADLAARVGLSVPITVTREQVVILEPPDDYTEAHPSLAPTTALPGGEWYLRPDFGGGILVATHHTADEVDPDRHKGTPDEEVILDLVETVTEAIPALADAGLKGQYCGLYSSTPDHDFVLDQAGPTGCYLACGFSGHGFKHAPAVGRIMRDMVVEGDTDFVDRSYFSLDRFAESPDGHGTAADNV